MAERRRGGEDAASLPALVVILCRGADGTRLCCSSCTSVLRQAEGRKEGWRGVGVEWEDLVVEAVLCALRLGLGRAEQGIEDKACRR